MFIVYTSFAVASQAATSWAAGPLVTSLATASSLAGPSFVFAASTAAAFVAFFEPAAEPSFVSAIVVASAFDSAASLGWPLAEQPSLVHPLFDWTQQLWWQKKYGLFLEQPQVLPSSAPLEQVLPQLFAYLAFPSFCFKTVQIAQLTVGKPFVMLDATSS